MIDCRLTGRLKLRYLGQTSNYPNPIVSVDNIEDGGLILTLLDGEIRHLEISEEGLSEKILHSIRPKKNPDNCFKYSEELFRSSSSIVWRNKLYVLVCSVKNTKCWPLTNASL